MSFFFLLRPFFDAGSYVFEAPKSEIKKKTILLKTVTKDVPKLEPPGTRQLDIGRVRQFFKHKLETPDKFKAQISQFEQILAKLEVLKLYNAKKVPIPYDWSEKTTLELLTTLEKSYEEAEKNLEEELILITMTLD